MYGKNLKARNASVNSKPGKDCWTEVEEEEEEDQYREAHSYGGLLSAQS